MGEDDRTRRIEDLITDAADRIARGDMVDTELLIRANPDLPELRERLHALKREEAVADLTPGSTTSIPDPPQPERIGPYLIRGKLGEGGFGIVYLAEQIEPVSRRVALKVIKPGMDSRAVLARFETERQALAMMDHPNVAKVFDAGTTDEGRPYFVMEYIRGIPITEHCDRNRLGIDQRLEFFITVCEAVQHAHQKGVIHRDLKPSNVLVYYQDDKPVPKVIDFGVAKAIDQRLTATSLFTEIGQLVGTPAYMSPEQADMTAQNIDTRSDIYSLGVLLYELLTGSLPIDLRTIRSAAFQEIRRIIREVDPEKPSTRFRGLLTSGGEDSVRAGEFAQKRRVDAHALAGLLSGDLDWITMRALEKDRTDRYATASEFAADIRNHLSNRPVVAGPQGASYHLRKFVQRNKGVVTTVLLVFLSLCLGLAGTALSYSRALKERDRADREAETSRFVSDFFVGLFELADPSESLGQTMTVRDVLDEGARQIRLEHGKQPLLQARLMSTIGRLYLNLGLHNEAAELQEAALRIRRAELGDEHLQVAQSLFDSASVHLARGDYEKARSEHEQALRIRRELAGDNSTPVADSLRELGVTRLWAGDFSEAKRLIQDSLRRFRSLAESPREKVASTLRMLGYVQHRQGRYDAAEGSYREALRTYQLVHGDNHPDIALTKHYLANLLQYKGDRVAAKAMYREVLEMYQTYYAGKDHPNMASYLNNFGGVLNELDQFEEAEQMLVAALEMHRRLHGDEHPAVAGDLSTLAVIKRNQGEYQDAESLFRTAIEIRKKLLGADNEWVGISRSSLGQCLTLMERYTDAEQELLEAHRILESRLNASHPRAQTTVGRLVTLYERWDRPQDAANWREKLNEPPKE